MDTISFANSIREKYPDGVANDGKAYKDIPDADLVHRVITKYPVYKDQVTDYKPYTAPAQQMGNPASFGGGPDAQITPGFEYAKDADGGYVKAAYNNPGEFGKGVVKGAIGGAAGVTKLIDTGVTAGINYAGGNVGQGEQGAFGQKTMLDYKPIEEQTALSNEAQEAGSFASAFLPVGSGGRLEQVGNATKGLVKDAIEAAPGLATKAVDTGADIVGQGINLAKKAFTKSDSKALKETIDAVNPDLSGKKLESAYQQVVKGDRTVKPSGIFTEQTLSPSDRAIAIGKRLASGDTLADGTVIEPVILKSGNSTVHAKNLPILKKALTNTEEKLNVALDGNPEINYNADRPQLIENLNKGLEDAPRGFRIGPDKPVVEDVFSFAKKVASESEDSIKGLREARTAFDTQAKTQYPNAFKEGVIDTKTAAGSAIKKARDIFNEHLYNTAPNGSDIQKLIGHEADIYQATEPIAAKAAKGEGMTKTQKALEFVKDHPAATVIGTAATTYTAAKTLGQ